ncbi:MAG: hypothetical protein KAS36_00520 [Anaerolineales bacterium]|nr:hypothetical protein [Anaerolineales bacterium]
MLKKRLSEILYESLARLEDRARWRDVKLSIHIPGVLTALANLDSELQTT